MKWRKMMLVEYVHETNQRRKYVHEIEAMEVLKSYRFQIIKSHFATTENECAKLSEEIGNRVVFKVSSPDIVHKTDVGALHMIESTKASKLLGGVRGEKPSDIRSIAECLQRMSELVIDFSEIQEINPLQGKGSKVVDSGIVIS